jgi:hypothetical protein
MYSKYWQIIKDDSKKTFEVVGQASNTNSFTNNIHGMQKAGMNVSYATPPVTNKTSSKDLIKFTGYTKEDGLHKRLTDQYREITMGFIDQSE